MTQTSSPVQCIMCSDAAAWVNPEAGKDFNANYCPMHLPAYLASVAVPVQSVVRDDRGNIDLAATRLAGLAHLYPTSDPLTLCNGCDANTANPNDPAGYCDECRNEPELCRTCGTAPADGDNGVDCIGCEHAAALASALDDAQTLTTMLAETSNPVDRAQLTLALDEVREDVERLTRELAQAA